MASVQLDGGKHTTSQACSGNIPHDFRERENYANEHIDESMTYLNQKFGCENGDEARMKLRKRIAECDAEHPPQRVKNDRKTSLEICIPAPREDLSNDMLRDFFEKAYADMVDLFGEENVIYGVSHFDEEHEYINPRDGETHMSRSGLHLVVVPWTDGQDWIPDKYQAGLNMNNFYRRSLPNKLNARLDAVCQQVFGFDYQDGTKTAGKETVEQLKEGSKTIEDQQRILRDLQKQIEDIQQYVTITENRIQNEREQLDMEKYAFETEKSDFKSEKDKFIQYRHKSIKSIQSERERLDMDRNALEAEKEVFQSEKDDFMQYRRISEDKLRKEIEEIQTIHGEIEELWQDIRDEKQLQDRVDKMQRYKDSIDRIAQTEQITQDIQDVKSVRQGKRSGKHRLSDYE